MSAIQSDLTKFGYDLVVATTQDAVNATMMEYLSKISLPATVSAYVYDKVTQSPVWTDYQALVDKVGFDPFSIPDGAGDDERVQTLYNNKFMFAFRAKVGLPRGLDSYPDIVTLDRGDNAVTYDMYFAEFEVLNLVNNFGDITWTNLSQPADSPWIFEFLVQIDLRTADQGAFSQLPASVQQQVKNLNPNSAFSVQQLYLDLNTAGLQGQPSIPGLDKSTSAYILLTSVFINTYWDALRASGGVILGISVTPDTPDLKRAALIPTDLTIDVSPNIDAQGNTTGDYGLYTLDYLVMSDRRVLPPARPFTWNWLDSDQVSDAHGAIAVRRDVFVSYLAQMLAGPVQSLCFETDVEMSHSGLYFSKDYSFSVPSRNPALFTQPIAYSPDADGLTTVLTFGFSSIKHAHARDSLHITTEDGDFNYTLTGSVAFRGHTIRMIANGQSYFRYDETANKALAGIFVNTTSTVDYEIYVDDRGELVAKMGEPVIVDDPQKIDPGAWDKLTLHDEIQMIYRLRDQLQAALSKALTDFDHNILTILNSSHAWVFPGGKTFVFKQAGFSVENDLVALLTYADPAS